MVLNALREIPWHYLSFPSQSQLVCINCLHLKRKIFRINSLLPSEWTYFCSNCSQGEASLRVSHFPLSGWTHCYQLLLGKASMQFSLCSQGKHFFFFFFQFAHFFHRVNTPVLIDLIRESFFYWILLFPLRVNTFVIIAPRRSIHMIMVISFTSQGEHNSSPWKYFYNLLTFIT